MNFQMILYGIRVLKILTSDFKWWQYKRGYINNKC